MSDNISINNPVEIKDNSVERVAFDLMEKIAYIEGKRNDNNFLKPSPREYYLTLYNQCHKVVGSDGVNLSEII